MPQPKYFPIFGLSLSDSLYYNHAGISCVSQFTQAYIENTVITNKSFHQQNFGVTYPLQVLSLN